MNFLWLFLFSVFAFADPSWKWTNAMKVVERHEFYANNEILIKPKGVWQTLFGVVYRDASLKVHKDCIYYRIPGEEAGELKIKSLSEKSPCDSHIFESAEQTIKGIKALQFSVSSSFLNVSITNSNFETEKWDIPLFNVFEPPAPKPLMSSAEYRSPKMIFLTPYKGLELARPEKNIPLPVKTKCHDIGEDCKARGPSTCSSCAEGWYEIPNGCPQGPKFCGQHACGQKGQPACRRGMKYQRQEKTFSCRDDDSFAFCAKGFRLSCEGSLAYCL